MAINTRNFEVNIFYGILAGWLSNIKETRIYLAWYVGRGYTEDPLKSIEVMDELFAAMNVMAGHAERKPLV